MSLRGDEMTTLYWFSTFLLLGIGYTFRSRPAVVVALGFLWAAIVLEGM